MSIYWNGSELNSLMLNGVQTTGIFNGEVVWGNSVPSFKTLTLYNSKGGTLTANKLTGYPGETINLTTAYDTYWRFSGYQLTGDGSLVGNDYTFGTEDASICACYKKNAFTAVGGWEKGSNVSTNTAVVDSYVNVPAKYATHTSHTGDIPASWYSTSNRWKPSNASAYSITLNPKMSFKFQIGAYTGKVTACSFIGGTQTQLQTFTATNTTTTKSYNKSFTNTTQGVNYGISARLYGYTFRGQRSLVTYLATATTGSWTATGYAP